MKVLLIDVSVNSSPEEVKQFIRTHNDADIFCIFDYEYGIYTSSSELLSELNVFRDDYFSSPSAFRDIVTTLLGKLRRQNEQIDVHLNSPGIDDCSIYSSADSFENYLDHIEATTDIILHDFDDASNTGVTTALSQVSSFADSWISRISNRFFLFGYDNYEED